VSGRGGVTSRPGPDDTPDQRSRIRAERRLGELLAESPKAKGTKGQLRGRDSSGGSKTEPPENDTPTLAESGIEKKQEVGNQSVFRASRRKSRP